MLRASTLDETVASRALGRSSAMRSQARLIEDLLDVSRIVTGRCGSSIGSSSCRSSTRPSTQYTASPRRAGSASTR
jgi:hypothetical protein